MKPASDDPGCVFHSLNIMNDTLSSPFRKLFLRDARSLPRAIAGLGTTPVRSDNSRKDLLPH